MDSINKKKIKNRFDFLRGREKTRVSIFSFGDADKVDPSPEPFEAGFEIQTIVTYDHETHFDVNKKKNWTLGLAGIEF